MWTVNFLMFKLVLEKAPFSPLKPITRNLNGPLRLLELREGHLVRVTDVWAVWQPACAVCSREPGPEDSEKGSWSKALRSSLSPSTFCRLCWVFIAARAFLYFREWGLPCSCGPRASHLSGFSWGGAQALGCPGFGCCSRWAQQLRLPGSRAQAQ